MNQGDKNNWDHYPDLHSTTPFDFITFKKLCHLDSKIIDIGCGYGRICNMLEDFGYRNLVGIDISQTQLSRAKKKLKYTKLYHLDAISLPFENQSFDCIITFGVIDCFIQTEDVIEFINGCNRILKPGGYWFINIYTRNDSEYFDEKYMEGLNEFKQRRVFRANSGIAFHHYSLLDLLKFVDNDFDLIKASLEKFLSFNQSKEVKGYSLVLQKLDYKSKFR